MPTSLPTSKYLCLWHDGEEMKLTRCSVDEKSGLPLNAPANADILVIIDYDVEEPTVWLEAVGVSELGIDNDFHD